LNSLEQFLEVNKSSLWRVRLGTPTATTVLSICLLCLMATSPFEMDGLSDDDFFDKLVDDDDQITKSDYLENKSNSFHLESAHSAQTAEDKANSASDALAKLVLDESEANLVASNGNGKDSGINELYQVESVPCKNVPAEDQKAEDGPAERSLSISGQELAFAYAAKGEVVEGSAEFDALNATINPDDAEKVEFSNGDSDDGNYKNPESEDLLSRQSSHKAESGKICTNVREVQWSNFNSLSTQGDLGGFGSYSDFFKDLPSNSMEQAGESGLDFFSSVPQVANNSVSLGQPITDLAPYQSSQVWQDGTLEATATAATQPELRSFSEFQTSNEHTNDMQNYYKNGQLEEHFTGSIYPDQSHGTNGELPSAGDNQDAYYNQDWENAYPGWKYDHTTGEWHQVEGYEAMPVGSSVGEVGNGEGGSEDNSHPTQSTVSYSSWQAQGSQSYNGGSTGDSIHHVESITGEVPHLLQAGNTDTSLAQVSTGQAVSGWEQFSQNVAQDQQNIYFDPQYPGWYYDLVAQEWRQVSDYGRNSYTSGVSTASSFQSQLLSSEQAEVRELSNSAYAIDDPSLYSQSNKFHSVQTQSPVTQLSGSSNDYAMSNGKWEVPAPQDNIYGSTQYHGGVFNNNVTGQNLKDGFIGNQSNLYHPSAGVQGELDQSTSFQIPSGSTQYHGGVFNNNVTGQNPKDGFIGNQSNLYHPSAGIQGELDQSASFQIPNSAFPYDQANHSFSSHQNDFSFPSSGSGQNVYSYSPPQVDQNQGLEGSHNYYGNRQAVGYSHPIHKLGQHTNHTPPVLNSFMEGRSSAGRPPHALVTFGFGGKLVVFNPKDNLNVTQDHSGGLLRVYSLGQLVTDNLGNGSGGIESSYFHTLCRQAFSSPLVGGNVSSKEMFKWIDERIASCEFASPACRNPELLRMLLCSLKIFCQHYGKFRSAFSVGGASQENDGPEGALTKLFASAKSYGYGLNEFSASTQCLQAMPSANEFQVTALEMKNLLVAGKRKEALLHAQQGQLWGPALVLAWQLGEKFYVDTVTQMAQQQFLPGSPLRTLCLLLAGQPAEVFSTNKLASSTTYSGTVSGMQQSDQDCMSGMLNDWQENLAIITANRTKGDERVIVHLGDCLWKERGEVAAAHTCYLVAEANFEYFSDTARLCLIGADHLKYPRTYASPEAIQRTELYEYAKILGNPQYILLSFQPYKLIYANMLAEIGKVSDSLRYCQAVSKILKNAGRAPEVEACRQFASSLEDRIRIHTQGGYSSNLAPSKLMGMFLTTIDRSIHRIIGAPPPPMPLDSQSGLQSSDLDSYSSVSKVENAFHPPNATTLMPSVSMEPLSEWGANNGKAVMQTRSVSEPDFSRSPRENQSNFGQNQASFGQNQSSFPSSKAESNTSKANSKSTASGGQSRFGRFGSQIFQKAVGLIAKAHNNEAKLGEQNKFYYDEKLKRWVEEGAAPPAEEAVLSAPPISAAFISNAQTPEPSYNIGNALNGQTIHNGGAESRSPFSSEQASGMPPVPPSVNQFSARGRLHGVRSRYVDTFNKGGGTTPMKSFQAPVIPAAGPVGLPSKANFFIPKPAASFDSNSNEVADISDENGLGAACTSATEESSDVPTVSCQESGSAEMLLRGAGSIHRYSSADNVTQFAENGLGHAENGSVALSSHSRAASWSGGYPNSIKQSEEPEALRTPDGNKFSRFSNMPGRVPGYFSNPTKLDAERPGSGGYVYASLPSPPPIEPPHSSMAFKQSLITDGGNTNIIYKQNSHGLQSGIQADSFGDDLQEVEL